MTTVEPIRNKKDVERVERYLQKQSARDHLIFVFGTNSGLRISDIVALNVGDVRNKNYVQIIEKKTGKTKRFPLNEKLKTLIAEFVKGKRDKEPLFKSLWGRRYNRITAYYMIREACKNVGLEEKIGTHSMRKTFGYHHYQQFKDVALLQKIFNHSSQQITLRYIGIEQDQIDYSYNNFVLQFQTLSNKGIALHFEHITKYPISNAIFLCRKIQTHG